MYGGRMGLPHGVTWAEAGETGGLQAQAIRPFAPITSGSGCGLAGRICPSRWPGPTTATVAWAVWMLVDVVDLSAPML